MAKLRNTIYYEFYELVQNTEVFRGEGYQTLGTTTIQTGIDLIPTLSFTIPMSAFPKEVQVEESLANRTVLEPKLQHYIIKVHIQIGGKAKYNFQGVVDHIDIDNANYLATLTLSHRVARMRTSPMPINYSVKNTPLHHVVGKDGAALGYETDPNSPNMQVEGAEPQVKIEFEDTYARDTTIEKTFGSKNKLAALTEVIEATPDLHFYVDLDDKEGDRIVIGRFGEHATGAPRIIISPYPEYNDECDEDPEAQYVTMLTEPNYDVDYVNHYNRAIVFCGDIQDGVLHLTLESIYANPELQDPNFPVGMYEYALNLQPEPEYDDIGKKINNEKIYQDYEVVAFSKNGNREFYVEDKEQLARDNGQILHTTYQFNDLYPIPKLQTTDTDGDTIELVITDDDRIEIAKRAYQRAIRKLKSQRPERVYQMNTTALPIGTRDGQFVWFTYSKEVQVPDEDCEDEYHAQQVVNINANLYITKRTITFDDALNEITTITLDHELRTRDTSAAELELQEAASGGDSDITRNYMSGITDTRTRSSLTNPYNPNPTIRSF